jgi:hypothetical protein
VKIRIPLSRCLTDEGDSGGALIFGSEAMTVGLQGRAGKAVAIGRWPAAGRPRARPGRSAEAWYRVGNPR